MQSSTVDQKQDQKDEKYVQINQTMATTPNEFREKLLRKDQKRFEEKNCTLPAYLSDHLLAMFADQIISFNLMKQCSKSKWGFNNGYAAIENLEEYRSRVAECFDYAVAKVKENKTRFACFQEICSEKVTEEEKGVKRQGLTNDELSKEVKKFGENYKQVSQYYTKSEKDKLMIAYDSNEVTLVEKQEVLPKLSKDSEENKFFQVARFKDNALGTDMIVINVHINFRSVNYLDTNKFCDDARKGAFVGHLSDELVKLNDIANTALTDIKAQAAAIMKINKETQPAEYAAQKVVYEAARQKEVATRNAFVSILEKELVLLTNKAEQKNEAAIKSLAYLTTKDVQFTPAVNDVKILLEHYKKLGLPVFMTGDFNTKYIRTNLEAGQIYIRENANLAMENLLDSCDNLIENAAAVALVEQLKKHKSLSNASVTATSVPSTLFQANKAAVSDSQMSDAAPKATVGLSH